MDYIPVVGFDSSEIDQQFKLIQRILIELLLFSEEKQLLLKTLFTTPDRIIKNLGLDNLLAMDIHTFEETLLTSP